MIATGYFENAFRTGYALGIRWTQNSYSVEDNTSNVTVTAYLVSKGSSYYINSSASKTVRLRINGTIYSYTARGLADLNGNQQKALFSQTLTIPHNTDGTCPLALACSFTLEVTLSGTHWGTIYAPGDGYSDYTAQLTRIPRPSTATVQGEAKAGSSVVIQTNRYDTIFTHTLQYSLDGSAFVDIAYNIADTVTWAIPTAFAEYLPNATAGSAILRTITYMDGELIGQRDSVFQYTIPEEYAAPSVNMSAAQDNSAALDVFICGESEVTVSAWATLKFGASARLYTFLVDGESHAVQADDTGTAQYVFPLAEDAPEELEIKVSVTDSRGFTSPQAVLTITPEAYVSPRIDSITVVRGIVNEGIFTEDRKGQHVKITATGRIASLNNHNARQYSAAYRVNSAASFSELIASTQANDYAFTIEHVTEALFDVNATYILRFTVSDSFGTATEIMTIRSQRVLMNFSADGKSICFGGIATHKDATEIQMSLIPSGGIAATPLVAGQDFDELTVAGWYTGDASDGYINCPIESGEFGLYIEQIGSNAECQRLRYFDGTRFHALVRCGMNGVWSAWELSETAIEELPLGRVTSAEDDGSIAYMQNGALTALAPAGEDEAKALMSGGMVDGEPAGLRWGLMTPEAIGAAEEEHTHAPEDIIQNSGDATDFVNAIKAELCNAIYPVGAIYISTASTSPATLFGGSWTRIEDRFLLAAGPQYSAGEQGGKATHQHLSPVGFNSSNNLLGVSYVGGVENRSLSGNIAGTSETVTTTSGTYTFRLPYTSTADNMPPYLVVYMWRRTA